MIPFYNKSRFRFACRLQLNSTKSFSQGHVDIYESSVERHSSGASTQILITVRSVPDLSTGILTGAIYYFRSPSLFSTACLSSLGVNDAMNSCPNSGKIALASALPQGIRNIDRYEHKR